MIYWEENKNIQKMDQYNAGKKNGRTHVARSHEKGTRGMRNKKTRPANRQKEMG